MLRALLRRSRLFVLTVVAALLVGGLPLASAGVAEAAVLSPPRLTSPAYGASISANPVLAWSAVSGASKYRVEVSAEAGFGKLLSGFPVTTQELRYAPTAELPLGEVYWRVAALDSKSTAGSWATGGFVRGWSAAPKTLTPADEATLQFPTDPVIFTWQPLAGAASYRLEIDDADDFIGAEVVNTKNTAYALTEPLTVGQPFYWRVRGVSGTLLSDWSEPRSFRTTWESPPKLVYPADNATDITDTYFDWDPVPGAALYQLQVSANPDWTNNKDVDVQVKSTRFAPPVPLNNKNYYWRVRAMDAASPSNYGSWSDVRVFQRGWSETPEILWPKSGISSSVRNEADPTWQNPAFSWTPVHHASWYRVRFATNVAMTAGLKGCITNRTTWSPSDWVLAVDYVEPGSCLDASDFERGKTYYWDVAALDAPVLGEVGDVWGPPLPKQDSIVGLRSTVESFIWDPPVVEDATPTQLQQADYLMPARCNPKAGCTKPEQDTPVFTWNPVPGATSYTVTVSVDPNFTNVYRRYVTPYNRLAPRDSWKDNQANEAYYWNVTPYRNGNPDPLPLDIQSHSMFQKRTTPVERTSPSRDAEGNPPEAANDFTFTWQDYLDTNQDQSPKVSEAGKEYRIRVSTVSDFATEIDNQVVSTPFYTPYKRTYPEGPIYWRVQAIDGSKNELTVSGDDNGNGKDDDNGVVIKKSPAPVPIHPSQQATEKGVPYLQWAPLDFAASYDVQLATDKNFSSLVKTVTTKMAAWAHTEALGAGTYYWRVRRNDADARDGAWSEVRSFVLQPAPVTLTSPTNGSNPAASTLLLQWKAAQPSPLYRVELSTSATFAGQVSGFPQDTVMSALAPKNLLPNGTYYWRVRSLNASKTVVATSSTWKFRVDSTPPSVTGLSPSSAASITTAFTVTFSEPVTGVDARSLTVTASGTSTALAGSVSVVSPTVARFTPKAALIPGQSYTVRVSAAVKDASGIALLPYSATVRTSTTVQENSVAVKEAWPRWTTSAASGGSLKLSQRKGSTLTYTFTGTGVALLGYQGTSGGNATITLDGKALSTVSYYAAAAKHKATIWSKQGLKAGKHVLQVKALGTKATKSKGTWVYVDGFIVAGTTIQETAAGVVDTFARSSTTKASGSAYDVMNFAKSSGRVAPALTLTFKGTGITWTGTKGKAYGKAYVYIDGTKKATVDLYASKTSYKQKLWTSAKLSDKVHTIKVVVLGSKRKSAKGYDVSFDSFVIK